MSYITFTSANQALGQKLKKLNRKKAKYCVPKAVTY